MALQELEKIEDLQKVWQASEEKPVLLFKQSTTCPVSAEAFDEFNSFLENGGQDVDAFFVKVRETRQVSDRIEEDLGVGHQSPQLFVVKNREAVWNASHSEITAEHIQEAMEK